MHTLLSLDQRRTTDMNKGDRMVPMTAQEEKEVHRVFELLSDYQQKSKIREEIRDINAYVAVQRKQQNLEKSDESVCSSNSRLGELNRQLQSLESKPEKKICCIDVMEMLKFLNRKASRKEVEEMIWEVDENLDGCLDWSEFRLMFNRNITDRTGLEPSRMFHLTQFLIYDTNQNGLVSVDETMNLLYARYGRTQMETKLKELFGEDMHEFGRQGGEINFTKFLASVEKVQLNMFLETNLGKKAKDLQKETKDKK